MATSDENGCAFVNICLHGQENNGFFLVLVIYRKRGRRKGKDRRNDKRNVLCSRGRPTSIILLLLVVVAQFSFPLSRHPPLGLHHLLCFVRTARGLLSLAGVEVGQVGALMRAGAIIVEAADRVRT